VTEIVKEENIDKVSENMIINYYKYVQILYENEVDHECKIDKKRLRCE
jgi:hypothetical protein